MARTRTPSSDPIAQMQRVLRRALPAPLADVLLPIIQWRASARRLTAVIPNQIWQELFDAHCRPICEDALAHGDRVLTTVCLQEQVARSTARSQDLSNFLTDPGNEFAASACRQVLDAPGAAHNPLYLHGPPGCGKSHLLRAVANGFGAVVSPEMVVFFEGPGWVAHDAQQLAERARSSLRTRIGQAACIVFDGVDALAERALAQEQLFHVINEAMDQGQQILLSGSDTPRRMSGLEDRLTTRLAWGLVVAIDAPLLETRLALLRQLAPSVVEDMEPAELTRLVDTHAPDMHHIHTLAQRLLQGEQIRALPDAASFDRVIEHVAKHYAVRPGDIAGKRRLRTIALARQTALMLGRRLTSHSLEALGGMVGGRDHSTVLYNIRQAEERCVQDTGYARAVDRLSQLILGS